MAGVTTEAEMVVAVETPHPPESENEVDNLNSSGNTSPKATKIDGKGQKQECNGNFNSEGDRRVVGKDGQAFVNVKKKVMNKPTGAVK